MWIDSIVGEIIQLSDTENKLFVLLLICLGFPCPRWNNLHQQMIPALMLDSMDTNAMR